MTCGPKVEGELKLGSESIPESGRCLRGRARLETLGTL